jgi:protein tyrosine phosphatase
VSHYRLTFWIDLVPSTPSPVLALINAVEEKQKEMTTSKGDSWTGQSWGPPIVVHIPGRTGTFVTIFNAVNQFKDSKTVNLVATATKIKGQRNLAMATHRQFRFCYESLIEYATKFLKLTNISSWNDLL